MNFIYQKDVNFLLRSIFHPFHSILPAGAKIPVSGSFKLSLGDGKSITINTNPTSCLSKVLYWDGVKGYEYDSIKIFMKLVKGSACFYDIGANIGYYSLIAAAINPQLRIVSFEPMIGALHYLQMNVRANDYKNISVEKLALMDFEGDTTFRLVKNPKFLNIKYHLTGDSGMNTSIDPELSEEVSVKVTTLDKYVAQNEKMKIDLIKMDVESAELSVMRGGKNILEFHRPFIQSEVLPGKNINEIEEMLEKYNYRFFRVVAKGLHEEKSLQHVSNSTEDNNYYFIPEEKVTLFMGAIGV